MTASLTNPRFFTFESEIMSGVFAAGEYFEMQSSSVNKIIFRECMKKGNSVYGSLDFVKFAFGIKKKGNYDGMKSLEFKARY